MIFTQIIEGLLFLILSLFLFTFPGWLLLKFFRLDLEDLLEKYCLSTVLGLVIFTITAYFLAWIHARFLIWILPILGLYSVWINKQTLLNLKFNLSKKIYLLFSTVLLMGIIAQVAVNAPSGWNYQEGIYFWSSHGHDGIWHLALMEQFHKSTFPFQNPEYAGHVLQNYHFFVDLLMSEITRMFPFSNLDIYFRLIPILFSVLLGMGSFIFVRYWSKNEIYGIWAMFFTYFVGSFGYVLTIPKSHNLSGESIFWVSQTHSVLGNPPHASAFIILTIFLFCLLKFFKTLNRGYLYILTILGGSIIEFKVYGGVLILGGLALISVIEIFKRNWSVLILFICVLALSLLIYLPNSINSQDFLIFHPWWYIRTMVVAPDRLDWMDLELRRQTYIAEGNWKRVIQLETTAFFIFLLGNLGMRLIGFVTVWKLLRVNIFKDSFSLFFLSITAASFFIPVFFLQKGVVWNSIQFNQYFLLLFGFLAAMSVGRVLGKIRNLYIKVILSLLIIILAVPTQIGLLIQFYSNKPLSKISNQELAALNFLKNSSNGNDTVLTAPFNKFANSGLTPPVPIYTWYDTGYVPAVSGRPTLISDQEQLTIMGYDTNKLFKEREDIFASKDSSLIKNFLDKYKISYVYLVDGQTFNISAEKINLRLIYKNSDASVYKYMR